MNISSRSALFTTDLDLALDASFEVFIKGPVLLDNSVQLRLIASGRIIRIGPGQAVLAIEKHEFRTCGPSFFQSPQPWQMAARADPAQERPNKSCRANLQVPPPGKLGQKTSNAHWEPVFHLAIPFISQSRRLTDDPLPAGRR